MNLFLYPFNQIDKTIMKSPYQSRFIETISLNGINIINGYSKYGVFDILLYLKKTNVYYFNFIENLPHRKFGLVQYLLFFPIFFILKIFRKKIIFVLHNKISHSKNCFTLKKILVSLMINYSDIVFTLAKEGIEFGKTISFRNTPIYFYNLPVENNLNHIKNINKDIDILIWGAISDYKGVDKFLIYLKEKNLQSKYNITIASKVLGKQLKNKILGLKTDNITLIDSFIDESDLIKLHNRSKNILFTYEKNSMLSSSALMYSLSLGANIIGPDVGAFRDL